MNITKLLGSLGSLAMLLGAPGAVMADDTQHVDTAAKVVEIFRAALQQGDANAALAQLSDDVVIFESGYAETRTEYANHHLEADIAFAKGTQRRAKKTTHLCNESLCVIMQQSETVGNYKGKPVRSDGVETTVLRREGDDWKIQHLHWSSHN